MDLNNKRKILVIAAHPDDEVIGCGGTLSIAKNNGCVIRIVFLGEGVSARFTEEEIENNQHLEQHKKRTEEAHQAMKTLGVDEYFFHDFLCIRFDQAGHLNLVKIIEKHIIEFQPDILLTHNPSETNIDHIITYEAVQSACRPSGTHPSEIYTFEIICSGNFVFQNSFSPNTFVDIEKVWEQKLALWSCYSNEEMTEPSPRNTRGLKILAEYRGFPVGRKMCEAFELKRKVCS